MRCRSIIAALTATLIGEPVTGAAAFSDADVARLVERHVGNALPSHGAGGASVVVRIQGRSLFFNYGYADRSTNRPVTSDTLFNLGSVAKVFDAVLLAQAVQQGELAFEDSVAKHVAELQRGGDIRRVTLRQLASFTSGLVLPHDGPPWTAEPFTTPERFIAYLNEWKARPGEQPGKQVRHTHSNYILLRLAFERRFGMSIADLMEQRLLKPLGLASTSLPVASADPHRHPRGELAPALRSRAVQGYDEDGTAIGALGDLQGFYHWLGTGQMYSSARDMAVMLAANLGELPGHQPLQQAMKLAQQGVLAFGERSMGALAWESHRQDGWEIVERFGGLNNATATIAMIPERKLGVVILCNRSQDVATAGQKILLALAGN
jgi:beta-lactamase class C